jgi:large subunit ribosomal protein L19e
MKLQKRLAAQVLKTSKQKVRIDPAKSEQVKEAITKFDVRKLIEQKVIVRVKKNGQSRLRARKRQEQKRKGRHRGVGLRKGKAGARTNRKQTWMNRIRAQRRLIHTFKLNKLVSPADYRKLYRLAKGGFFRSVKHIKAFAGDKGMIQK